MVDNVLLIHPVGFEVVGELVKDGKKRDTPIDIVRLEFVEWHKA
jgi:hypothetical protein